ncbi:MAG: DUF2029 domain-containing protein [Rhodospirillales bacterium]|nr:DUF2029 domain-containing protein [Rhodospirillales bacterium]
MPELLLAFVALALMAAAAMGAGTAVLCLARADVVLPPPAKHASAFVLGMGVLGWFAFPLAVMGWLGQGALIALCLVLALGLILKRPARAATSVASQPITVWTRILVLAIGAALVFDSLEGLAPPTDADSLAYHFALPREFLAAGKIFFVPRAADGAIPLLQHMSYMTALGIGGERAMTLWTMLTGWSAAGALYALARRHLARDWSLALALLFLTTPAVIYGAGAGQVEVRSAAFVLVTALAIMEARRLNHAGFAAVAGLAAGFFAGSKYPGLLFVPLAGLAVVLQRRWFRHGFAFAAAALATAAPFYLWHWWNTGDPFYPMLYGLIDYRPGTPWNADIHAAFKNWTVAIEKSRSPTLPWAVIYPFLATLAPDATFESERTGFGPIALLLLPMALAGAWTHRERLRRSPLTVAALLCLGYYLAWFLFGASQRVRHFLPIYPLLLICLVTAAIASTTTFPIWRRALVAAIAGTLVFQLTIHAVFAIGPARYILSGESRETYLQRSVSLYDIAAWANAHLTAESRLLHSQRQLNFLLSVPYFYGHPLTEARIDLRPGAADPARFWGQMGALGITHVLADSSQNQNGGINYLAARLLALGCIRDVAQGEAAIFSSRTIISISSHRYAFIIFALDPASCPLERLPVLQPGISHQ